MPGSGPGPDRQTVAASVVRHRELFLAAEGARKCHQILQEGSSGISKTRPKCVKNTPFKYEAT